MARCQLHAGIRYVPVASKLRISLPSVKGTRRHRWYLGGTLLDSRFLHNGGTDFDSGCGRLLGSMSATQRYKVRLYAIKTHEVVVFCGGTTLAEFYLMADSSTMARRIPIRIAGGC